MPTSSSKPVKVNFKIKQGDTFRRVLIFQTLEDIPQPVDVSGAEFKMIIEGEPDLILGNGLTVQGDDNNEVLIQKDVTWMGKRKYEFERVMNGITWTPIQGYIKSETELDENE